MKGTVYVHAAAGRALRRGGRALGLGDVVDCAGTFHSADNIHIVIRGDDGGQNLVATARVELSIAELQLALQELREAAQSKDLSRAEFAVCLAPNIAWLWPPSRTQ